VIHESYPGLDEPAADFLTGCTRAAC